MSFFKMKTARIGFVVVFVVILVFGLALMGSVLSAKPQNLPVALVVLDQPATLPDGSALAVGEMVKEKLKGIAELPVKWVEVSSEADLETQLDEQKVYGALVLPADLSSGVASLQSPSPKPATVRIVLNEGTNAQAVSAVRMILQQVTNTISSQLSGQLLGQIGQHTQQMPVSAANALLHPFQLTEQVVHPAGSNNANGSAPNLLVQIMWLACMVASAFLFVTARQHGQNRRSLASTVASQLTVGVLLVTAASAFLLWMAHAWYGMAIAQLGATWLYLWLMAVAFFLVQTALLNWIGLPSMLLLVLIFFFSIPVIGMPQELLPQVTVDWLYSWTPLRYAAAGLRSIMYFAGKGTLSQSLYVLAGMAAAGLILAALAVFKPRKAARPSVAA
ncbi:ABC transporter permease [Paenibacillus sp. P36]|uniref:YhgE/Pip domain-containing protein n=1 Tax=Paenibacillus sp. P36 TaxID=3342538 RepID=UPI0038B38929